MNTIYLKPSGRRYYVSFFILFLALSAILHFAAPFLPFNAYAAMFILLILYFIASGIVFIYFQQVYMHVEDEVITVKRGIITRKVSVVPFSKITEVSTEYSLPDTLLGVGTVTLELMGPEEDDITFRNIPKDSISSFLSLFKRSKEPPPLAPPQKRPEPDRW